VLKGDEGVEDGVGELARGAPPEDALGAGDGECAKEPPEYNTPNDPDNK